MSAEALKMCYKGLVREVRTKAVSDKKKIRGTGGGNYQHNNFSSLDEEILARLGPRGVDLKSNFDNDNMTCEGKYKILYTFLS